MECTSKEPKWHWRTARCTLASERTKCDRVEVFSGERTGRSMKDFEKRIKHVAKDGCTMQTETFTKETDSTIKQMGLVSTYI